MGRVKNVFASSPEAQFHPLFIMVVIAKCVRVCAMNTSERVSLVITLESLALRLRCVFKSFL
jgi:hypothetical protein